MYNAFLTKSCAVIGFPSGQVTAIFPFQDYTLFLARKQEKFYLSHMVILLLTRLFRATSLDIAWSRSFAAILTSSLVNYPYI